MKKIIIFIMGIMVFGTSCQNPFELTPTGIISGELVFKDENLANAFLADLYEKSQFSITSGGTNIEMGLIGSFGGESRNFAPWQSPFGLVLNTDFNATGAGVIDYWPYELIRESNVFIEGLSNSEKLSEKYTKARISEARFIRAFAYFEMAKRFGGVPILKKAQSIDATGDELFVKRNSEKEVYDFIATEMDEIAALLPSVPDNDGRISKWTALALKSRAMLYAGSIANFGTVQLNGLLGIPKSEANSYYKKSLDASKAIMASGVFKLYNKNPDKAQNFIDLFLDENANSEVILAEKYDQLAGKSHAWDITGQPAGFGFAWNSNYPVYLETLENFDFIDGTSGKVDRKMYDDKTAIDPEWYFEKRDPRMRASIFYPGTPFKGKKVYFHRSTDYTDPATKTVKRSTASGFIIPGSVDWPGAGDPRHIGGNPTGLLIRKRINPATPDGYGSSTDIIIFRLGEVMLNYVEAAFYLGDPNGDMAAVLNDQIRDRAGMPALTKAQITEDKIRQERRVELAFEEHTFWDLRRWRTAVQELDNVKRNRMHFRYNYDTKKYTIAIGDGDLGRIRLFKERNYYYALGLNRISDNPNLIENPGY
jgi:starch-binding outer membrane protein, SusD/RagB family